MKIEIANRISRDSTKEILGYERVNEKGYWEHCYQGFYGDWKKGAFPYPETKEIEPLLREPFTGAYDKYDRPIYPRDTVAYEWRRGKTKGGICVTKVVMAKNGIFWTVEKNETIAHDWAILQAFRKNVEIITPKWPQ